MFDNLGRMTQMSQITDGQTYTSKYTYNLSGALVEEEYPSGRKVKNEFESDGDISRIYGKDQLGMLLNAVFPGKPRRSEKTGAIRER